MQAAAALASQDQHQPRPARRSSCRHSLRQTMCLPQQKYSWQQHQEQQVLLEMQHTQQLQLLLQQEQAIMQQLQLQEQASLGSDGGADAADSSNSAGESSSGNIWWWLQQLQRQATAAAAPATTAAAPAAASAANKSSSDSAEVKADAPPSDWFVCDGPTTDGSSAPMRYFVIQGSITLDHWRINLTIDPSEFEGGAFGGVKVHRGVYEAALEMLDVFVPYVREHLAKHPDGKIAFTGHSLGGSLATLLMLLLVHRGVLPPANVVTVRTFGAPAIFCEGATGSPPAAGFCQSCSLPCQHRAQRAAASAAAGAAAAAGRGAATTRAAPGGLLGRLGLPEEAVVNVVMTRDIVPRAFVCDYTLVADVLKSWRRSFKEHVGLADCKEHKALYNFIGTMEVLQPSAACPFVLPDEGHSMLPHEPALYKLTEPCCSLPGPAAAEAKPSTADTIAQAAASSCSSSSACGSASGQQDPDTASSSMCCSSSSSTQAPLMDSSSDSSSSSSSSPSKKGKLSNFGSWGSLTSLSSISLTSAIADLTSRFTLVAATAAAS
ncbi:hypothetical protein COO60DRAFT_715656 [Scenedesmus sp. NREL 46B-D3]|nr:hypothetical protein COO60DRAFT_715656 [Scenedesmus sp. NREL 46B-D3]